MTDIRLCCFDLGGVLVRICRSWAEGCAAAGIPDRTGSGGDEVIWNVSAPLHLLHQTGQLDATDYADQLSRGLDGLYSADEIRAVHTAWLLGTYDGTVALLERLSAANHVTAALSNTNAAHWADLVQMDVVKSLAHRLASHELGLVKPDAAIFRRVETELGVRSEEIVFFDDLQRNIDGALAAGWRAFKVDPLADTAAQMESVLVDVGVLE